MGKNVSQATCVNEDRLQYVIMHETSNSHGCHQYVHEAITIMSVVGVPGPSSENQEAALRNTMTGGIVPCWDEVGMG
eukprot:6190892-Pleurochrysis_carterae.AAC.2